MIIARHYGIWFHLGYLPVNVTGIAHQYSDSVIFRAYDSALNNLDFEWNISRFNNGLEAGLSKPPTFDRHHQATHKTIWRQAR